MDPKARALLFDIQQAGILVERFTSGKSFDDYLADPLLLSGVERRGSEAYIAVVNFTSQNLLANSREKPQAAYSDRMSHLQRCCF